MSTKLDILHIIKFNPMNVQDLSTYFKQNGKKVSKNALRVSISRLKKDGFIIMQDDKICYSDPIESQREAILKELKGKPVKELKDLIVVLKGTLNLVKRWKIVKKKLLMVI